MTHFAWLHDFFSNKLTLQGVNMADITQAKHDYPYFSNLSQLKIRKNMELKKSPITQNASVLPDRKHLFYLLNEGNATIDNFAPSQNVTSFSSSEKVTPLKNKGGKIVILPKYEKPILEIATEIEEEDEDLNQLEEKLLGRMNEENAEKTINPVQNDADQGLSSLTNVKNITREFDRSVSREAFGKVSQELKSPGPDFLNWLSGLDNNQNAYPRQNDTHIPNDDLMSNDSDSENLDDKAPIKPVKFNKEGKTKRKKDEVTSHKSKKKGKKIARQLAKKSIQPDATVASETLAQILIQQGHFEEAIKMYQRLILHNPEKNKTFAAVIEKLKEKRT